MDADGNAEGLSIDELSSDVVSDMAMIASSVASRPTTLSRSLQRHMSPTNLQLSAIKQAVFKKFTGKPNTIVIGNHRQASEPGVQIQASLSVSTILPLETTRQGNDKFPESCTHGE
jgi:hypothetical protein